MTVFLDQFITRDHLYAFLKEQFPQGKLFLEYLDDEIAEEDLWFNFGGECLAFQYEKDEELSQGFEYYLAETIGHFFGINKEKLSREVSQYFKCRTFCDASRLQLIPGDPYYSISFENGKVYFVSDYPYNETGEIKRYVEMTYDWPEYDTEFVIAEPEIDPRSTWEAYCASEKQHFTSAYGRTRIYLDQLLERDALEAFLSAQFPERKVSLNYLNEAHQPTAQDQKDCFRYQKDPQTTSLFGHYLSCVQLGFTLSNIEKLSRELAKHFDCRTFCTASRLQVDDDDPHRVLLFENDKVFFCSDPSTDGIADVVKIVELSYDWPEYDQLLCNYIEHSDISTPEHQNKGSKA